MERQIARWLTGERSGESLKRVPIVEDGRITVVNIDEYMKRVVNERRAATAEQVYAAAACPSVQSFIQPSAGMIRPTTPAVLLDNAIGQQCEELRLRRLGRG